MPQWPRTASANRRALPASSAARLLITAAGRLRPSGSASVGIGYANDVGRRFGQYNGINEKGAYGLIDFNWVKRNDESGTWTRFFGRDAELASAGPMSAPTNDASDAGVYLADS